MTIRRVVVLGHTGLIGSRIMRRVAELDPGLEVEGRSLGAVDLGDPQSAERLADLFDPATCVVMCVGVKRQLGDSPRTYQQNTEIITTFAELLARRPVGRLVYLSSAAVYGEDVENLAIDEGTPLTPRSYYGLAKITAEWILQRVCEQGGAESLCLVRPATVYGPGDVAGAYGPSGFLESAVAGRPITLWGDGSELREFLFVDDVGEAVARLALGDHAGPVNLASGRSYRFTDALEAVRSAVGRLPEVASRPRSKAKVDNRFDARLLKSLLPDLVFTSLTEGVARTAEQRYGVRAPQEA